MSGIQKKLLSRQIGIKNMNLKKEKYQSLETNLKGYGY